MQDRLLTLKKTLCSWFPAFVEVRTAPISIAGKSLCPYTSIFKHPQPNTNIVHLLVFSNILSPILYFFKYYYMTGPENIVIG